jgi:NADH dehydrogenase
MAGMRIVVLGGTGFVGRALVARLARDGHALCVLSRNRNRHRELWTLPEVEVHSCDVYSVAALEQQFRAADAVINLVGILNEAGVGGRGFRRAHVELTRGVIEAMQKAGVRRLIQMSALNAGRGASHYLKTRGEAEALVKASGLDWSITQPSVIFGPGDGLFTRFAGLLALAPVLPIAKPNARFAPVYVGDVAEVIARCLADHSTIGKTFELYGPRALTLREIVRYTAQTKGLHRLVIGLPDFLGRLQALAMDFVPGKPFSTDNWLSLQLDSVGTEDGLRKLGIDPTPMERIVPRYLRGDSGKQDELDRYRRTR